MIIMKKYVKNIGTREKMILKDYNYYVRTVRNDNN